MTLDLAVSSDQGTVELFIWPSFTGDKCWKKKYVTVLGCDVDVRQLQIKPNIEYVFHNKMLNH